MVETRSRAAVGDKKTGERLKEARMAQGLTLDEVAHRLRIPPHHLRSLEKGDVTVFAAEVYARGAFEKYARFLGVTHQEFYYAFLRTLSGTRERVPLRLPVPATWLQRALTPVGFIFLGISVSVLAVAGYLGWQVQSFVRVPVLELLEPDGAVVEGSVVTVSGVVEEEAEVHVNKEPVLLNGENTFSFELPVRPGINVLQVEATGVSGRVHTITRELLVSNG